MPGFLLHLSGPRQSYGTSSTFNIRTTLAHPTRSAVLGMIAAAFGYERGRELPEFTPLALTIRIDRPGIQARDFHTIGGGRPAEQTPPTAIGGRRAQGKGVIVTERDYLTDAAFTVAVTHPDPGWVEQAHQVLRQPQWPAYLGRRSCPTDALLLPTGTLTDPVAALVRFPLHRFHPNHTGTVPVTFVTDSPPAEDAEQVRATELNDNPLAFTPDSPGHRSRKVWYHTRHLPAELCAGYGNTYLKAVADTVLEEAPAP